MEETFYLLFMVLMWFCWKGNVTDRHKGIFVKEMMKISCRDVVPGFVGICR